MKFVDRFKQHWFVSTLVLCSGVAVATWALEYSVLVLPRDFEIHKLEREVGEKITERQPATTIPSVVLQRTWVSEGSSVTADDGSCFLHVDYIGPYRVDMSVTVGTEQPRKFKDVASGTRLTVQTHTAAYNIDVHEIEVNSKRVAIEVTRQLTPESSQK